MKNRVIYLDLLRILAAFAVIVIHVSATDWYILDVKSYDWLVTNTINGFMRWSVPIFVMISGVFLLNPKYNLTLKKLYFDKILKILLCLLIWGIGYHMYDSKNFNIDGVLQGFNNLIHGISYSHLWFLYMLVGLYIVTPIIRTFLKSASKRDIEYWLLIWIIYGIFITYGIKTFLPDFIPLLKKFDINILVGYLGFFIAGYYFSNYDISEKLKKIIYSSGIIILIISLLYGNYQSVITGNKVIYFDVFSPGTVIITLAIFIYFKNKVGSSLKRKRIENIIKRTGSLTFGIYLIHFLVIKVLNKFGIAPDIFNPLLSIWFISTLTFIISAFIIYVMSKIPIVNKYLV